MKNIKKILAIFTIAAIAFAMAVSAYAAPADGTKYELDLSLQKASSDRFYFGAISKADNTVVDIEDTSRASWSPDYPAFWVKDATGALDYVVYTTEKAGYMFDLVADGAYKSFLAFKAPASGKYSLSLDACKYQGGTPDSFGDVVITKRYATTPLWSKLDFTFEDGTVDVDLTDILLAEGEELWIIYTLGESNTRGGASNFGITSLEVTFVEAAEVEPTPVPANPNTADNIALAFGILALTTAGIVIASKKRR